MIGTDATLAGVVGKTTILRPPVQREHSGITERAVTHRRNIQQRSFIRFLAVRSPNPDQRRFFGFTTDERVGYIFIPLRIHVPLCPKGNSVPDVLCPLINRRALLSRKRFAPRVRFDKILVQLWTKRFEHIATVPDDRIVP